MTCTRCYAPAEANSPRCARCNTALTRVLVGLTADGYTAGELALETGLTVNAIHQKLSRYRRAAAKGTR